MNDELERICLMKVTSQHLCEVAEKNNEKYLPELPMSQPRLEPSTSHERVTTTPTRYNHLILLRMACVIHVVHMLGKQNCVQLHNLKLSKLEVS